jgi:hypothetical protein
MAINFNFSTRATDRGIEHYAQVQNTAEPRFLVGKQTNYLGNTGLFNVTVNAGLQYRAADYTAQHGFWAHFIAPTAKCESEGSFYCLNTYDRAQFTFGFMQYAAHVANGDFVHYLRRLLQLPDAQEYFPRLRLKDGLIHYQNTNGALSLLESTEAQQENNKLMDYLNPRLDEIEPQELICAARMVHWAMNSAAHREIQVDTAIELFKKDMATYAREYNLNGMPDKICLVICDIRHQGRARSSAIINALNTNGNTERAYNRLLVLGEMHYPARIRTLRTAVAQLVANGVLGVKKYSTAAGDFVAI